jgi:hypothetical protein
MNSGQSAGISPYNCQAVIMNLFTIGNNLSMMWNQAPFVFAGAKEHRTKLPQCGMPVNT